jgi:hypothetical protein
MDRLCRSSWKESHESFQAEEYDAGASPAHQASQCRSGRQLDKPTPNFENTLELLRNSLMKSFIKGHTLYIVMDLEQIALVL